MTVFISIVLILYVIVIAIIANGYSKKEKGDIKHKSKEGISIIIPYRNEEKTIENCLNSLIHQKYDGNYEIILVNDHSDDNGEVKAKQFVLENKFNNALFLNLNDRLTGKKQANLLGINNSKYSIIAIFDADCVTSNNWLDSVNKSFYNESIVGSLGEVIIKKDDTFLNSVQHSESILTSVFTVSGVKNNKPLLISAANFSFRKSIFNELDAYSDNTHITSGDDIFLLDKILKKYGAKSLSTIEVPVFTNAVATYHHFFNQRLRWLSKMKYVSSLKTTNLLSVFIAFVNTSLLVSLFVTPNTTIGLFPIKYIADLMLLSLNKQTSKKALLLSPFLFLWWMIYPLLLLSLKPFIHLKWKEREVLK